MRSSALACLVFLLAPATVSAGGVLDRVRSSGVLHCGAPVRPGLAFPARDGAWHGLEVDLCRAAAVAALGEAGQIEFHGYTLQSSSLDKLRSGADELSFMTASDLLQAKVLPDVLPGPPVFYATSGVMVLDGSPARQLADLRDKMVCAEPGTGPERSLIAWFEARHLPMHFFMFQESDEMLDAFYGGRCDAIAHDTVNLAAIGLQAEEDGHPARLLPEPLTAVPILAVTPRSDGDWAAIVAWTVATVMRGEMQASAEPGGSAQALPLAGKALGLAGDWQAAVLKAVGHYGDVYRRNVGADSPLDLPRGLNAFWTAGGLLCPPFTE